MILWWMRFKWIWQDCLQISLQIHYGLPCTNQTRIGSQAFCRLECSLIPQAMLNIWIPLSPYDMYYILPDSFVARFGTGYGNRSSRTHTSNCQIPGSLSCGSAHCRWKMSRDSVISPSCHRRSGQFGFTNSHWQNGPGTSVILTLLHPLPLQCF